MINFLETTGKVMSNQNYLGEAKKIKTLQVTYKKKESELLKKYYEEFSKPMPAVMTFIIGASGITVLLLIVRYFVFGLEKIEKNPSMAPQ
jgi:hypothetical protein